MPVVILLDVSLSMCRPVSSTEASEEYQLRHLAVNGLNSLLDHIGSHNKLEFTSLIIFSSLWELLVPFTRDVDAIHKALDDIDSFDKTCITVGLSGAASVVHEQWGSASPCQVIVVTDGMTGIGEDSLSRQLARYEEGDSPDFPLPFTFPGNLYVICLGLASDPQVQSSLPLYQKLIDITGQSGQIYTPDAPISMKSVQQMFSTMASERFTPYTGTLCCGNLKCQVQVLPHPQEYTGKQDFHSIDRQIKPTLDICGFLDVQDLGSPPYISRHLVLPLQSSNKTGKESPDKASDEDDTAEDGKSPAFTVLLHGSLKVEGMVALVEIGDEWYGCLYSWADSKKKSNLMLSIFQPGTDVLPWLGNIKQLGPCCDFPEPVFNKEAKKSPFPVRPVDRRSYAQNCVVWIKQASLQADIQKVLRHARKLPEKLQNFYKELNRVRRAALSFGFDDLLDALAALLERECQLLPGNAHPEAALQLTHAANSLRLDTATDYSVNVLPMTTNFTATEGD